MDKKQIKTEVDRSAEAEVKITGELSAEAFSAYWPKAYNDLAKDVTIDGFRSGKAPEKLIIEKIGQEKILMEMANLAMQDIYPQLIEDNEIDAIGRPEVNINKLAKDNPLGFSIKTAIIPSFKLPDYKALAKKVLEQEFKPQTVEEKDIEMVENELNRRLNHDSETKAEDLPPLNDEMAQKLGDFKTVKDLREKIKENLEAEKTKEAGDKKKQALIEAISEATKISIPEILIEAELDKMIGELRSQIESSGLKFDDYLNHLKKTEADLRKNWKNDAEKRVKAGLILQAIAEKEALKAEEKELKEMTERLVPDLGNLTEAQMARLKAYAENLIINDKVFSLLTESK